MAVYYKNADKLARAKVAVSGKGAADSVEAKAFGLCASEKDEEAKVLCIYQKLGGAFEVTEDKKVKSVKKTEDDEDDDTTEDEKPKRGRPAKETK